MSFRILAALGALLLCAASARAATPPAPLRTEVIAVTPPAGWVMSVWRGGTIELAEFTPPGQTGGRYIDLLGYSVWPKVAGMAPMTPAELPAFESRNVHAECGMIVQTKPAPRADGWYAHHSACLGQSKARNSERLVLNFVVQKIGEQGVFRVWREWRGTTSELSAMIKARTGVVVGPVFTAGASMTVDDKALDSAIAALEPVFMADVAQAEICDLRAPAGCTAFRAELPPEATQRLRGRFVAGFAGQGLKLLPREEFRRRFNATGPDDGSPNRVFVVVEPKDIDWNDAKAVDGLMMTVGTGIVSDGGSLVASDWQADLSAEARANLRVQVLMAGRRLWREGFPPGVIAFRIPAE